jgi:tetratricopeptide (TPR) repeat protein
MVHVTDNRGWVRNRLINRPACALFCLFAALPISVPSTFAQDTAPASQSAAPQPSISKPAAPKAKQMPIQVQRSLELNEQGVAAIKARNFTMAEELFNKALEVDNKNITAVFNLAGMYITNKKDSQAVALLEKYTLAYPKDAGLMARLGDAYFSSQNAKQAIVSYEKALKLDPNYPTIPARLGTLYSMTNKISKAAEMYERATKQNPKDHQSLQNLSSLYLALGKPQQAISTAKKALQLSASAELYVTLGNAYQGLKDDRNALMSYQRAKELGYKDPAINKVIDDLARATSEKQRT